jgi:hypothetical protein
MNLLKDRSNVLSTSSGKRQAGSSFMFQWYWRHSQQTPLRLQGSQVQLHFSMFFSLLHSFMANSFNDEININLGSSTVFFPMIHHSASAKLSLR